MSHIAAPESVAVAAFALNNLLQVTAISLLALCASRFYLRRDPPTRYSLSLISLVFIFASLALVAMESMSGHGLLRLDLSHYWSTPLNTVRQDHDGNPYGAGLVRSSSPSSVPLPFIVWVLVGVWSIGAVWAAARLICGRSSTARLTDDLRPWDITAHGRVLDRVQSVLGSRMPSVFTSPHVNTPLVPGLVRHKVILPEGLAHVLSAAQLRQVLLHECAHVAFRHALGGIVARLAAVVYWPHPLVRALSGEMTKAREDLCDNVALLSPVSD